jgi:RNA polymerase sigma factor (sigma-70 family)
VFVNDVTGILDRLEDDDPDAVRQLFATVYDELRNLAARQLESEQPGHTLQATALVHEAWMKLMAPFANNADNARSPDSSADAESGQRWKCRSHFFGAAAEAMRRILVDNARRRNRLKRGGDLERTTLDLDDVSQPHGDNLLESLDEALRRFQAVDATACQLVNLRYFAGLSQLDASKVLKIAPRTADRLWAYAKAWLLREIQHPKS